MAVSKQEYREWKEATPDFAVLHKLHAEDVNRQFGGIPRAVIMSWDEYDRYIHLDDLCAYDLLLVMLGAGVMLGQPPFMLDAPREWHLAVGNKFIVATGDIEGYNYRVRIRPMTPKERREQRLH